MNPIIIFVCLLALCAPATANAQQLAINPPQAPATANPQQQLAIQPPQAPEPAGPAPRHCYAMNYVLKELDGTKVINQRSYVLEHHRGGRKYYPYERACGRLGQAARGQPRARVRSQPGKKALALLPVTDFNYIDIGVNIDNAACANLRRYAHGRGHCRYQLGGRRDGRRRRLTTNGSPGQRYIGIE